MNTLPKGFNDFAFLSFLIILMVTIGGTTGQKISYYFLVLILLSMLVINSSKVNQVLTSIQSNL